MHAPALKFVAAINRAKVMVGLAAISDVWKDEGRYGIVWSEFIFFEIADSFFFFFFFFFFFHCLGRKMQSMDNPEERLATRQCLHSSSV